MAWYYARETSRSELPPPTYDPAWGFELEPGALNDVALADVFQALPQPQPAVPPPRLMTRAPVSSVSFSADVMGDPQIITGTHAMYASASASFDGTSCCLCQSAPRYRLLSCRRTNIAQQQSP